MLTGAKFVEISLVFAISLRGVKGVMPREGDGPPTRWLKVNRRDGLPVFAFQERVSIFKKHTSVFKKHASISKSHFHFQKHTFISKTHRPRRYFLVKSISAIFSKLMICELQFKLYKFEFWKYIMESILRQIMAQIFNID